MKIDNNESIENRIKDSLEFMNREIPVKQQYLANFKAMIDTAEKRKKEKLIKDTFFFCIACLTVLSIEAYTFMRLFPVFIGIQLLGGLLLPVGSLIYRRVKAGKAGIS
ncbi:MAG: DUF5345 family protein [Bacillota bacterium]|nr:DUF5345 family protein [Bacillota bacterium]